MDSGLPEELFRGAVDVLNTARTKITDDSDIAWISYNSPAELRDRIRDIIERIEQKELEAIGDAYFLFLPTGAFQEHAISNGWTEEYMNLAERFDKVYELTKGYGKRS